MNKDYSQFLWIVFLSSNKSQIDIPNFSTSDTYTTHLALALTCTVQTFIGWSNECNVVVSNFISERSGMNDVFIASYTCPKTIKMVLYTPHGKSSVNVSVHAKLYGADVKWLVGWLLEARLSEHWANAHTAQHIYGS